MCRKCYNEWQNGYRLRNRDKANQRRRARYAKNDNDKIVQNNSRCKALGIKGSLTFQEWEDLKASYGHRCAYCGLKIPMLVMDHFWPVSLVRKKLANSEFVTNGIENILPVCNFCNMAKFDKPFIVFLAWKNGRLE